MFVTDKAEKQKQQNFQLNNIPMDCIDVNVTVQQTNSQLVVKGILLAQQLQV